MGTKAAPGKVSSRNIYQTVTKPGLQTEMTLLRKQTGEDDTVF